VRLRVNETQEHSLRDLLREAQRRSIREELEAERSGQVTGGVWGFVSYGYRITFETGDTKEAAWLHATSEAAWLDFGKAGYLSFTRSESAKLWRILVNLGPDTTQSSDATPSPETQARAVVQRLPFNVAWKLAIAIDVNCDSIRDYVFVAKDHRYYYAAAAVAPFSDSVVATYVTFPLGGDSQDALCAEPSELQEEALDADIVDSLGSEPEGWTQSQSCKGLRLEAGDCDSFHLYWNAVQKRIDWWRL